MITVTWLKARKLENVFSFHLKLTQNWSRSPASNLTRGMSEFQNSKKYIMYSISANSFRGNFSFMVVGVRQLFKGGNY